MSATDFRFRVVDESGRSSTVWVISVAKRDIYVTPALMSKSSKVSLHESGSYSWSLRQEHVAAGASLVNGSRHIAIWQKTEPVNNIMSHIFRIAIPTSELRYDNKLTQKKHIIINAPPEGYITFIDLYLSSKVPQETHEIRLNVNPIFSKLLHDRKFFVCSVRFEIISRQLYEQICTTKEWCNTIGGNITTFGVARIQSPNGVSGMIEFNPEQSIKLADQT